MKQGQRGSQPIARYFVWPLVENPESSLKLTNTRNGAVLADLLLTAFDSTSRRTGLLRHDSLPAGTALIIAPCNAIHTFFMRFTIDVAFVARDGRILKVHHALRPWRLATAWRAFAAVELPAGTLARVEARCGDLLQVA